MWSFEGWRYPKLGTWLRFHALACPSAWLAGSIQPKGGNKWGTASAATATKGGVPLSSFRFVSVFSFSRKAPNVGAGICGIWGHREEAQRRVHEIMRLAEARLVRHALRRSMSPKLRNTLKYRVEEMRPKWPFLKHRTPKMRLVEAQCAHQKHCFPETPLGSDPTSRTSHFSCREHWSGILWPSSTVHGPGRAKTAKKMQFLWIPLHPKP